MKKKTPKTVMSTDQLIDQMARNLTPVVPAKLGILATVLWILMIVVITSVLVGLVGHLRSDVLVGPMPARLIIGLIGVFLTIAAAGAGFVRLLIPGRIVPRLVWMVIGGGVMLIISSVVAAGWTANGWDAHALAGLDAGGWHCSIVQSLYAVILALPLIFGARYYAPVRLRPLALLIGLMAVAAGFGGLLIHCVSDDVVHLAVYHLLPAVVLSVGTVGLLASRLRW